MNSVTDRTIDYQSIADYGVVGDMETAALIGKNGSVDYMCFPHFDSPSIFAALLDKQKGGSYKIAPQIENITCKQMYFPDTNVLLTRFLAEAGVGEIIELMPIKRNMLIRRVTVIKGEIKFRITCSPRFNYGLDSHSIITDGNTVHFKSKDLSLSLHSSLTLSTKDNDIESEFVLKRGETAEFILTFENAKGWDGNIKSFAETEIHNTIEYWKNWIKNSIYKGNWKEIVNRSALLLKLLTAQQYGSMVAAPTFGLPEFIGGERNWDYRYCWIRDASLSVYALVNLGFKKEVRSFIKWVEKQCEDIGNAGHLGIMYTIQGNAVPKEKILNHFEGYQRSSPVRIGNDAYSQLQLDIYGELIHSVYLYNKYVEAITFDFWEKLQEQVNWLSKNWEKEDDGIWEVRGGRRVFLYSRLMCWVAFDRIIKIGKQRSLPYPAEWEKTRDKIFLSIHNDFWSNKHQAFVQFIGADSVDATTLLMPLMKFISPRDKKWLSTLKAIEQHLISDGLVYRYNHAEVKYDSLRSDEGTFTMCSFWYIESLCKSGQLHKGRFYFEKMLGFANHLGLYSEELGPTGAHLGNFPQAFTHIGLINAALTLSRHFKDERNTEGNDYYI